MSFLYQVYRQQFRKLPTADSFKADLSGKTVVVVGSNTGCGLEAAKHLATMMGRAEDGGKLILACRNVKKGEEALTTVRESSGFTGLEVWEVDIASFSSIKSFATRFEAEGGGRLDLLVMNAGITGTNFVKTEDGWESQLQVNFLGTAHLSLRMIPFLSKGERQGPLPRVVVVSSDMSYVAKLTPKILGSSNILEAINNEESTPTFQRVRYGITKLLGFMFVRALAEHIPSTSPLEINAANPGLCKTSLQDNLKSDRFLHTVVRILKFIMGRSVEEGGRSIAYASVGHPAEIKEEKPFQGKFVSACEVLKGSPYVLTEEGRRTTERVWTETIELLSRQDDKISNIVSVYLK